MFGKKQTNPCTAGKGCGENWAAAHCKEVPVFTSCASALRDVSQKAYILLNPDDQSPAVAGDVAWVTAPYSRVLPAKQQLHVDRDCLYPSCFLPSHFLICGLQVCQPLWWPDQTGAARAQMQCGG